MKYQYITITKNIYFRHLLLVFVVGLFNLIFATSLSAKTSASEVDTIISPPAYNETAESLANKFALMALFAKTSYRKDIKDDNLMKERPCDSITKLPLTMNWKRLDKQDACYKGGGLYYETYVHTSGVKYDKAVIAIRGTEFTSEKDWKANLSGVFHFNNSEYDLAKKHIVPLINALKKDGVDEIYLSGHSLGGGIAQEIAYLTSPNDLTATYTFNTSPVTEWMKLHRKGNIINDSPKVYRVYMSNEILGYIRKLTSLFNHKLPDRHDIKVYSKFPWHVNPVNAHVMSHLTCYLAEQVTEAGAQFDYSKKDADLVLNDNDLCPKNIID